MHLASCQWSCAGAYCRCGCRARLPAGLTSICFVAGDDFSQVQPAGFGPADDIECRIKIDLSISIVPVTFRTPELSTLPNIVTETSRQSGLL